jgi:Protein of unknown function (DUF3012)
MKIVLLATSLIFLTACTAEPGSERWCKSQKEIDKSEWTGNDAKTYAKHCVREGSAIDAKE